MRSTGVDGGGHIAKETQAEVLIEEARLVDNDSHDIIHDPSPRITSHNCGRAWRAVAGHRSEEFHELMFFT